MGKIWSTKIWQIASRSFLFCLYMQLIHQYFMLQIVQISPFTNELPFQNFPTCNNSLILLILLMQSCLLEGVSVDSFPVVVISPSAAPPSPRSYSCFNASSSASTCLRSTNSLSESFLVKMLLNGIDSVVGLSPLVAVCSVATEGGSVASDSYLMCLMNRLAPGLLSKLSSGSTESLKKVVNQPTGMIPNKTV